MIQGEHIKVDYILKRSLFGKPKKVFNALKDISLHLKTGETLGIVGESGSGKSTLGRAIMQILDYRGNITFAGKTLANLNKAERQALKKICKWCSKTRSTHFLLA